MKFLLYGLAGVVLGGSIGYIIPLTLVAVVFSGQQPVSFFWTGIFGAFFGLFGGVLYAGVQSEEP